MAGVAVDIDAASTEARALGWRARAVLFGWTELELDSLEGSLRLGESVIGVDAGHITVDLPSERRTWTWRRGTINATAFDNTAPANDRPAWCPCHGNTSAPECTMRGGAGRRVIERVYR